MSTANFYIKNAKGYYVIGNESSGSLELGMAVEDIQENGKWDGWDVENEWRGHRSWDEKVILSRRHQFRVLGSWFDSVEIQIVFRPGYYAAGVLDWDIKYSAYLGNMSEYPDGDCFVAEILNDCRLDMLINANWNEGIWAINRGRIEKAVEKGISEAIERAEEFCKAFSDNTFRCIGVASNGEAFYERV